MTHSNNIISEKPLVSVVINCFNGEKYLSDALDSVIAQTYKNWEIIFWDNKSTDKSAEIFKSYKDSRLKYYCASLHADILYEARNYALKKTNGDFIAFLDVDDWWLPNKLEKQIPIFDDPDVGLVYGNLWRLFEKKNKKEIYRKKILPTGMISDELLHDYVIGSPTYVIRKKSLDGLDYHFNKHFHIIGDFDLNLRLAAKWKVNCVQDPVATARIHGQNVSLLHKNREIDELKVWHNKMKIDPTFSQKKSGLNQISLKILYLETMQTISVDGFRKNFIKVIKYPFCFNKIKLIIALLLPKFVIKKIINY